MTMSALFPNVVWQQLGKQGCQDWLPIGSDCPKMGQIGKPKCNETYLEKFKIYPNLGLSEEIWDQPWQPLKTALMSGFLNEMSWEDEPIT